MAISAATTHAHADPDKYAISHSDPSATRTPVPTRPPIDIPGLQHPKGIAVDLRTHRLYVASRNTHVVYEVDPGTSPATVLRAFLSAVSRLAWR